MYLRVAVTISRASNRWFVSFKVETIPQITEKSVDVVGVDLGVKTLATLSTGEVFDGAKYMQKVRISTITTAIPLADIKPSFRSNWKKTQLKIAQLHNKIANIRKDTLHKLTTYLALNHSQIVIEDLNVSGMMANHKLAKAVLVYGFLRVQKTVRVQV